MDQRVISEKLEALRRCIRRITEKRPDSFKELEQSLDLQDIISVNLERAVQQAVDIGTHIISDMNVDAPATMAETFTILEKQDIIPNDIADDLRRSVGFRNIAVHNYQKINWEIVFNICHKKLDVFKQFTKAIEDQIL